MHVVRPLSCILNQVPITPTHLDDLTRFTRLDASRRTLPSDLADHAAARWEAGLDASVEWYLEKFAAAGTRLPDDAFPPLVMADLARMNEPAQATRLASLRAHFPARSTDLDEIATIAAALSEADAEPLPQPLQVGQTLGKYTLSRRLGEGAFGEVWLAWDSELSRHIALKVLHDERSADAALLTEARASAALDHPSIAKVHAVGAATPAGDTHARAYIDMQLVADPPAVEGEPPDAHIAAPLQAIAHPLPPREAAAIAAIIARALAAAHARGIVHGDMKPGNALRTPAGRIMVVDFGLACRTADSLHTRGPRITGTPAYLAPEQASGGPPTPASDIYAAGATLRFLLTGKPLYEPSRGSNEPQMDIINQVRSAPPANWAAPVPRTLRRIAERATARNVDARYTSADQFAADLEAWLHNQPVLADPPSTSRRVALWYRRNRLPATIAAAALLILATVTVRFVYLLKNERDDAIAARAEADAQAIKARAAAELAQKKSREAENAASTAEATSQFMERMLVAAMPQGGGKDVKVIDAVNRAVDFIPKWVGDRPEVESAVRSTIGKVYMTLADWTKSQEQIDKAIEIRRRTLGPDHPLTIRAEHLRAQLNSFRGEGVETEPALRSLWERSKTARGPDDEITIAIEALLCRAIRYTKSAESLEIGRDILQRRTRTQGADHQDTIDAKADVARALGVLGNYDESIDTMIDVLKWRERELGYDNHFTLVTRSDLAALYLKSGKLDRAEQLFREVCQTRLGTLGPTHPNTLAPIQMYAYLVGDLRHDTPRAIEILKPVAEALLADDTKQSSNGVIACRQYADFLIRAGRSEEGVDVAKRTLPAAKRLLRPSHDELKRLNALINGTSPPP